MSRLSDDQVKTIARQLASRMLDDARAPSGAPAPPGSGPGSASAPGMTSPPPRSVAAAPARSAFSIDVERTGPGGGLFSDMDEAVAAAGQAFRQLSEQSLARREEIIASVRTACLAEAETLARAALDETGLGRYEDKVAKNRLVALKTPGLEMLPPTARSGDRGLTLMEPAPFGVLGAITPTTNPTSTIICNGIGMMAAGNSVVFNAHPNAKRCSAMTIRLINQAVEAAGGPENLLCGVVEPTIASAQALMKHPDLRLLVVTGGAGVVREAMSSGKRAICAGPGNPPVVVDETADIAQAGRDIVNGASLDNNIICVDEKEVFAVEAIADALLESMRASGAYVMSDAELRRVESVIFSKPGGPCGHAVMNKDFIGKDAAVIMAAAGIEAPAATRLAVAQVEVEHPLIWTEQMLPVLPLARVSNADSAIGLALRAEQGNRHSAAMHSMYLERLSRMARSIDTSIFVKNGSCAAGLGYKGEGYCSFSIASPTGEGLTGPHSFSRQRRCVLVDQFRIV